MVEAGFEVRTAIMRLYFSFRGGDRPKNAEREFPEVCVTPKGAYEPWMLFRKPIEEKTVAENLRKWKTGGLRGFQLTNLCPIQFPADARLPVRKPYPITHASSRNISCVSLVRALLPLGEGTLLDPFMGSGSTIAAAEAIGYDSIGVELDEEYFKLAERSIPRFAALYPDFIGEELQMNGDYGSIEREDKQQLAMVLAEKKVTYRTKLSAKMRRN